MTDFEKVYNFENLYRAYRKARRGKRWKEGRQSLKLICWKP